MNGKDILYIEWTKIGMLQYVRKVNNKIYLVIEARFLEYSDVQSKSPLPVWCLCKNKIDLENYLSEDGSYTKKCCEILKHSYGEEDELKRIFPDKERRYMHLACLLSRNIPISICKAGDEFEASLNDAELILAKYLETYLINQDI